MSEDNRKELERQTRLFILSSLEFINKSLQESESKFLKGIRFELKDDKCQKTNNSEMMRPVCPDCGDESCFKYSKCVNLC